MEASGLPATRVTAFAIRSNNGVGSKREEWFFRRFMTFVHHILGRYHGTRVKALYPLYVWAGWWWTVSWIWADSHAHQTFARRVIGTIGFSAALPYYAAKQLFGVDFGKRPGAGEALAAQVGPAEVAAEVAPAEVAPADPA